MRNLVFNDIYKVFTGKKMYIFIIISLVFLLILSVGIKVVKTMPDATNDPQILNITGQSFPLVVLDIFVNLFFPIFLFMIIVDLVTEELVNGTAKFTLLRPVKRGKIVISKAISVFLLLTLFLVINLIIAYCLGAVILGWEGNFIINGISLDTVEGIVTTISSYLISLVPLFAFGMVFLILSIYATSASSGILIGLGLMFLLKIVGSVIRPIGLFIITEHFALYTNLIDSVNWNGLGKGVAVSLVYSVLGLMFSIKVFKEKDILF
ncbi:MAG: ABC transporter permease subunit [Halanaerobiales bacterium]|nr:ABC transporter permease subunit [Halanaerobiales bacterium]